LDAFAPDVLVAFFHVGGVVERGLRVLGPAKVVGYAKAGETDLGTCDLDNRTS
jgi:hypothetical protein